MGRLFRERGFDAICCCLIFGLTAHLAYRSLQGESGLFALWTTEQRAAELRMELSELQAERARLTNLTRRLSDRYLDLDLLDERARAVLGHVREDEIVIR